MLAADVETSPNLRRFTLGPRLERKSRRWSSFRTLRGSREDERYTVHVSFVSFARFALGPEARGARKRARRHGALLTISRDCRSHPRSPPLVCHPTNSLSAARERSQVRVRRAYTLSRAPRSSRTGSRKIIIILTVRAASPPTSEIWDPPFVPFLYFHLNVRVWSIVYPSNHNENKIIFIHCKMWAKTIVEMNTDLLVLRIDISKRTCQY